MRKIARSLLGPVAVRLYRHRPLDLWPRWAGDVLDIKVPRNVPLKSSPSPTGGANVNIILRLLERTREVPGDVAECGVFRGASLCAMALYLAQNGSRKRVFGLDSFQGFDASISPDLKLGGATDREKRVGGFGATSLRHVSRKLARLGLDDRVTLVAGYFVQSLRSLSEKTFSFVHLDCDIYNSYKQAMDFFYPRMSVGGIILLDEYNDPPWPGCNLAVDEFLADKVGSPVMIVENNYIKYYIEKGSC